MKRTIENLSQKERDNLQNLAKKYEMNPIMFRIEYINALNNGHPNPKDALIYAEQKVTKDIKNQYKTLKENNIICNF